MARRLQIKQKKLSKKKILIVACMLILMGVIAGFSIKIAKPPSCSEIVSSAANEFENKKFQETYDKLTIHEKKCVNNDNDISSSIMFSHRLAVSAWAIDNKQYAKDLAGKTLEWLETQQPSNDQLSAANTWIFELNGIKESFFLPPTEENTTPISIPEKDEGAF